MKNNVTENKFQIPVINSKHYLLLFLLWPFLAFITALTNYNYKGARTVVYLFIVYYGLSFVMTNSGTDSEEYVRRLINNAGLPFSDFFKIVGGIYASNTSVDVVEPLISFIVSRFTTFHGIYFAVWASLFGLFYLKSINLLQVHYRKNPGWNALIFMVYFIMVLPPTSINGARMWTAAWIFFFGAYNVIVSRDVKYLFVALSSSLVHFSFLSANMILIIYFLAGNRNYIYLPIAILSFILPQLMASTFQSLSLKLGGGLQGRIETYSNSEYIRQIQESYVGAEWFMTLANSLVFNYFILLLIIIKLKFGYLMKEKAESNLFSFLILFLSFVNFGSSIPTLGGRFKIIFLMFATFYCTIFFTKLSGNKISLLTIIGLFPMALNAALTFRLGTESVNAWILTPGVGLPLLVPGLSVASFLFPN